MSCTLTSHLYTSSKTGETGHSQHTPHVHALEANAVVLHEPFCGAGINAFPCQARRQWLHGGIHRHLPTHARPSTHIHRRYPDVPMPLRPVDNDTVQPRRSNLLTTSSDHLLQNDAVGRGSRRQAPS
jgi:hypothetical protein